MQQFSQLATQYFSWLWDQCVPLEKTFLLTLGEAKVCDE